MRSGARFPRLRAENSPWNTNVDALELAYAQRGAEFRAAYVREELTDIATAFTSLQLPAATTADAIALRANVQAQQQFIAVRGGTQSVITLDDSPG